MRQHPLRVLRHYDAIKNAAAGTSFRPIRCNLDLTNLCNYKCPWCEPLAYRNDTIAKRTHSMKLEVAAQVFEDLVTLGCPTILFTGGGEPMVYPQFGQAIRSAKSAGLQIAIDTNGSFIDKWADDLMCVDNIRVSLNAADQGEYDAQTGEKGNFERVCEAIRNFTRRPNRPEIGLAFVVSECNKKSEYLFESLTKELGCDFIFIREERGQVFGTRNFRRCYSSMSTVVIGANGDVQACCTRRDLILGNVNKQRLLDLWTSAEHARWSNAIVPQLCSSCVDFHFNEAVEQYIINDGAKVWII